MEEEKFDPEQEVDGSSASQPEEGTPGKLEEKKAFMKNGDENSEGDLSLSEEDYAVQVDVTATPDSVRGGNFVSGPEDEFQLVSNCHGKKNSLHVLVCSMDWDCFKAQDLVLFFNSFKPSGGVIHLWLSTCQSLGINML